jgi:hypothetical protein
MQEKLRFLPPLRRRRESIFVQRNYIIQNNFAGTWMQWKAWNANEHGYWMERDDDDSTMAPVNKSRGKPKYTFSHVHRKLRSVDSTAVSHRERQIIETALSPLLPKTQGSEELTLKMSFGSARIKIGSTRSERDSTS